MTAAFFQSIPAARSKHDAQCVRFARMGIDAMSWPGAGLPRGYFCSVTPP